VLWSRHHWSGLPDENFTEKLNSAKKGPEKGQTGFCKARKKPNFVALLFLCHKKSELQEYQ